MSTLGEKLSKYSIQSQRRDTVYMSDRARKAGPEELKKFLQVQDFFTSARNQIIESIENGDAKISIQVGGKNSSSPNMEVWHLLCSGSYSNDPMKQLASDRHPYHCLWRDFSSWANDNELAVSLEYRHDGGGMYSWFDLVCKPDPALLRNRQGYPRG